MIQLILHGIGDYFFQTDWQAVNKKKKGWLGAWACFKHCFTYTAQFAWIGSLNAVLVIFITHFIIDRTNIVAYGIAIKNGTKKEGTDLSDGIHNYDISNFGFSKDRPFALSIWLYIICDNLTHIICNYIALKYL